ncbi:MAG: hypothetical protein HY288_19900 [Planctomycetia bacterium]|nr:hypothetical protein [Planctomycetia bacterium]
MSAKGDAGTDVQSGLWPDPTNALLMKSRSTKETRMQRKVVLTLALVFGLATSAKAALSIVVGAHSYPMGTTVVTIPIQINGTDNVTSTDINLEIADSAFVAAPGNFPLPGVSPAISWDGAPSDINNNFMSTTSHLFGDAGSDSANIDVFENLSNPSAPISAQTNGGKLINLIVDFTGFNAGPGTWRIILGPHNGNGSTDFFNVTTPVPVSIEDGTVTIVPEPTSIVLGLFAAAGLGIVAIRKRRARRA